MTHTRNTEILRLRANGLTLRDIATETGATKAIVEHVLYGQRRVATVAHDHAPAVKVRRKCLRCRKEFDAHPGIYRCDPCKDSTLDVWEGAAAVVDGGVRGRVE
jgi:Zn finger protein HypA/HybF involved in hydrogenase expression